MKFKSENEENTLSFYNNLDAAMVREREGALGSEM